MFVKWFGTNGNTALFAVKYVTHDTAEPGTRIRDGSTGGKYSLWKQVTVWVAILDTVCENEVTQREGQRRKRKGAIAIVMPIALSICNAKRTQSQYSLFVFIFKSPHWIGSKPASVVEWFDSWFPIIIVCAVVVAIPSRLRKCATSLRSVCLCAVEVPPCNNLSSKHLSEPAWTQGEPISSISTWRIRPACRSFSPCLLLLRHIRIASDWMRVCVCHLYIVDRALFSWSRCVSPPWTVSMSKW